MHRHACLSTYSFLCLSLLFAAASIAAEPDSPKEDAKRPKVVLVGDSIRLSYQGAVAETLAGKATVVSPKANGGDSGNVLRHLDEWVIREQPDVVHFNCGIHDTKKFKTSGRFQVSPEQYEENLRRIVQRIQMETHATVLFATSTPLDDKRAAAARQEREYELLNASIDQYNAIAVRVMKELKVPVDDLNGTLKAAMKADPATEMIVADGVHMTGPARALLGETVAKFIAKELPQPE